MKIEVLYFEGCPNHQPTVEQVQRAMHAEGIGHGVEEVEIKDDGMAQALGFLGSPSVRINGLDIEKEARAEQRVGFGCRTYMHDGGRRSGVPTVDMIRTALVEASDSNADGGRDRP